MTALALFAGVAAFGVICGSLAGLLGVGGGVLIVPFLTLVVGLSQHRAEATSLFVILPTAIVATFFLARRGVGNLRTAFVLGIAGAIGSVGGATLALELPGQDLRLLFALFAAAIGVKLVFDGLRLRSTSIDDVR